MREERDHIHITFIAVYCNCSIVDTEQWDPSMFAVIHYTMQLLYTIIDSGCYCHGLSKLKAFAHAVLGLEHSRLFLILQVNLKYGAFLIFPPK